MATDRQKAPPRRISWRCACFNLRRAAREATRLYDEVLAPSGLTATRFTLLGAIGMQGDATLSALAIALDLDRTTLTRNLAPLEKAGLISFARGRDRRERRVSLTQDGDQAVRRAMPLWHDAQAQLAKAFEDDGLAVLMRGLDNVADHVSLALPAE